MTESKSTKTERLTTDLEWMLIRKAARQWSEQVDKAMPGPEPFLGVLEEIVRAHMEEAWEDSHEHCTSIGCKNPYRS